MTRDGRQRRSNQSCSQITPTTSQSLSTDQSNSPSASKPLTGRAPSRVRVWRKVSLIDRSVQDDQQCTPSQVSQRNRLTNRCSCKTHVAQPAAACFVDRREHHHTTYINQIIIETSNQSINQSTNQTIDAVDIKNRIDSLVAEIRSNEINRSKRAVLYFIRYIECRRSDLARYLDLPPTSHKLCENSTYIPTLLSLTESLELMEQRVDVLLDAASWMTSA